MKKIRKKKNKRKLPPKKVSRKRNKISHEAEPLILWDFATTLMEKFDYPNPWRDINVYVDFLCDAIRIFFEDSIYFASPEEICLYIDKDNIWSIKVARPEAKSELSYYKCIEFTKIGQYQYDKWSDEEYFDANRDLVRNFVEENFDSAYFD